MAERFKAPVLKTGVVAIPPWVRIPLSPPITVFALRTAQLAGRLKYWLQITLRRALSRLRLASCARLSFPGTQLAAARIGAALAYAVARSRYPAGGLARRFRL